MSSFRKALKSRQRNHHERSQPGFRKHLGLLEKKKDYKLRADDYHKKQNTLAALRKKALDKNPDEFYYNMINSQLQDGVHVAKKNNEEVEVTEEQKKVMRTQDIKYVEMKRVAEAKKIERLKGELHLLEADSKQKNKHTFFVDSKTEVQSFDLANHLNTAPELRIDREKKMFVISQKIQTRKDLQDKNKKVKVQKETPNAAAIYKFEAKRKR
ncbi:hypothetical protein FQN60_017149 [Etheostoma spectabile]|uniref:Probable U3 small nucleolar RNA-associated protein 11 n=1 Tax=Etheostoma spectabile TaxID=54343 RepID=A0A5J5DEN1_9PERO|nr:hypothetical protein FQN60_017149 [Etheostoma spectabile]